MAPISATHSLDFRGKTITTFILFETSAKLRAMQTGEVLELVTAPFEAIENDIRAWCRLTGQEFVDLRKEATEHRFSLRKVTDLGPNDRDLAMVVSDAGLEALLSPLGFALAAALAGTRVHLYFQGPAVRVLTKGFRETLPGVGRPFSRFARKGLAKAGHLPAQEKLRQLRDLGARLYVCGPSMEHFGVKKSDLAFDDVTVGEYLTFLEVMDKADLRFFLQ
jgi:predicted peroxiredoxin/TusA-related sulfurtransferase